MHRLALIAFLFWQVVPKVWDDRELASFELPLIHPETSARHASSDYYYRIPARPIYKSYPIYAPGKEPVNYLEWLQQQEPEVAFEPTKLKSSRDWIKAGEIVFDAPIGYGATFTLSQVRDPAWYERNGVPVTRDGIMPFSRYVIRKKGVVEVGSGGCLMCHARVMPDGSFVKGAQGNFPVDRVIGHNLRRQSAESKDPQALLQGIRLGQRAFFAMPWLQPDPMSRIDSMSLEEIASAYEAVQPGTSTRVNLSLFSPAQIPDLIGVADRKYLDHTGVVRQRSIADLMRYIALVQGANSLDRFGSFTLFETLPDPSRLDRYSDEQLYALAQFLYSLKPPPNPNKLDAPARRGRQLFSSEGCDRCHTPPLYTSNKLSPVGGFNPPAEHIKRYDIIERSVGTDPELATRTRKGTGYYKVPSLKGVWYRGALQHNGAAKTLEDWLNPDRIKTVPGHSFGLSLSPADRAALIAFLRTL
jgi:cytochrome c2